MPIAPSEEMNFLIAVFWKVVGFVAAFIGGVVAATWAVASKVNGIEANQAAVAARQVAIEKVQQTCQGQTLVKLGDKIDALDKKMDDKLERIHERFDEFLLKK